MKVVTGRPPNYDRIVEAFGHLAMRPGVIFCYGDTIYNPGGKPVPPSLVVHERAHSLRQEEMNGPEFWWDRYIADPAFRLAEEIIAHRAEWMYFNSSGAGRNARRVYLSQAAHRLASPLYGSLISAAKAKQVISAQQPRN